MHIVCGTDFSPGAEGAVRVAAAWARTRGEGLVVVHAGEEPDAQARMAERVARGASVPTLVVRDADRLTGWLGGGEPLRVLAAVDDVEAGARGVSWMAGLAAMGPVTAMLGHVVWPPGEHRRLGAAGPIDLVSLAPEVKAAVAGRLATLAASYPGTLDIELRVGWGKVPAHLAHLAAEVRADLVVIALTRRGALDRLWRGSVTHGLLATAETNVVCVPVGG